MKHLFLINPVAGKYDHTEEFTNKIKSVFDASGAEYEIACSHKAGEITELTKKAAASGGEYRVYACGGDGTLNEAVCGAAGCENVAVTHFPGGSGNDFIKLFSDPDAFRDLNRLLDCKTSVFDLIEANGSYSACICSMGFDARIGTEIAKYKRLPLVTGSGAYKLSTAINLIKGVNRHYAVEINGETVEGNFAMICVCNGRWYGGGFMPVPEAMPDDGKLEVLLVNKVSRLGVASLVNKYKAGKYADYPEQFRRITAERLVIHCDKEEVINLDGEARHGKDVEIKISEKKLRFFYPKDLTY